ncbi:hypothetical protein [Paraburkholderia phytofirmans]|uniref:hypothetical protein n=1 Tax=Paraburkholderia phytofirmans TaxID=261302 RepID=UPI0011DF0B6F|nr:hypothetical protein [Paraburkholderia phytofirmans]
MKNTNKQSRRRQVEKWLPAAERFLCLGDFLRRLKGLDLRVVPRPLSLNARDHYISNDRSNRQDQQGHHNHDCEREAEQIELIGSNVFHHMTARLRKVKNTANP